MTRFSLITVVLTLSLAGCMTSETKQAVSAQNSQTIAKPLATTPLIHDRQIHVNDIVVLHVVPGKEFEKDLELTVNLNGEILIPLAGWVKIEGMTTEDAQGRIKDALDKDYLVNPNVSLRLKEANSRAVVILGQVKKPGTYEFPPSTKMTLMEAVAKAEGFTDIANLKKVKIVRSMSDGSQQTIRVDAEKLLNGDVSDIELQEGDLITVPETIF